MATHITVVPGDITRQHLDRQHLDAVVNTANSSLLGDDSELLWAQRDDRASAARRPRVAALG